MPKAARGAEWLLCIWFTKFYVLRVGSFLTVRLVCSHKKRIDAAVKDNGWTIPRNSRTRCTITTNLEKRYEAFRARATSRCIRW